MDYLDFDKIDAPNNTEVTFHGLTMKWSISYDGYRKLTYPTAWFPYELEMDNVKYYFKRITDELGIPNSRIAHAWYNDADDIKMTNEQTLHEGDSIDPRNYDPFTDSHSSSSVTYDYGQYSVSILASYKETTLCISENRN